MHLKILPAPVHYLHYPRPPHLTFQYSWPSPVAQMVIRLQHGRPGFDPWVGTIPWQREWLPSPAFWPGEFHGQRRLAGYGPWGRKGSDTTEQISHIHTPHFKIFATAASHFSVAVSVLVCLGCYNKNTIGWVAYKQTPITYGSACMLSHFSCVWLLAIPWTVAGQDPLPSSKGSPWPRDQTHASHLLHLHAGSLLLVPPGKNFIQPWRLVIPRSGHQQICCLVGTLFLVHRWDPLAVSSCGIRHNLMLFLKEH